MPSKEHFSSLNYSTRAVHVLLSRFYLDLFLFNINFIQIKSSVSPPEFELLPPGLIRFQMGGGGVYTIGSDDVISYCAPP